MGKNSQHKKARSGDVLIPQVKREFSSGGVVFRKIRVEPRVEKIFWLVRATMPSLLFPEKRWTLPKGWIDDESEGVPGPMASGRVKADESSLIAAALREVLEEGGVKAKVVAKIGTEKYYFDHPKNGKILKFVTFFLMEWVGDLPEGFDGETSEVKWLPFQEAYKILSFSGEKQILKKANEMLIAQSERASVAYGEGVKDAVGETKE